MLARVGFSGGSCPTLNEGSSQATARASTSMGGERRLNAISR